jgi:hypothetical protein
VVGIRDDDADQPPVLVVEDAVTWLTNNLDLSGRSATIVTSI